MGQQQKLLLPWTESNGQTVINSVLNAWQTSQIDRVVVVVRGEDTELLKACEAFDVDVVTPAISPEQMKSSIQIGLRHLKKTYSPLDSDYWLVAPADLPTLTSELINRVLSDARASSSIVVPRFGDSRESMKRGHPVAFPWRLNEAVFELGEQEGLNRLTETHPVKWLDRPGSERPIDMDTPEEYQNLREHFREQ